MRQPTTNLLNCTGGENPPGGWVGSKGQPLNLKRLSLCPYHLVLEYIWGTCLVALTQALMRAQRRVVLRGLTPPLRSSPLFYSQGSVSTYLFVSARQACGLVGRCADACDPTSARSREPQRALRVP